MDNVIPPDHKATDQVYCLADSRISVKRTQKKGVSPAVHYPYMVKWCMKLEESPGYGVEFPPMYPKTGGVCLKDMLEQLKKIRAEHGRFDKDAQRNIVPRSRPVIVLRAGNEFGKLAKGTEEENAVANGITENADLFGEVIDVLRRCLFSR
jgi:hypothetical protein